MKLNLGCSDAHLPGYVNVDRVPPADQIVDLTQSWPWPDSSVEEIVARDIIEHLPNMLRTMNEAHRVLRPGGIFKISVPTTDGAGAWQDPTHCSFWNRNSFWYYEQGDPHHERFHEAYGVTACFRCLNERLHWWHNVAILDIELEAVK